MAFSAGARLDVCPADDEADVRYTGSFPGDFWFNPVGRRHLSTTAGGNPSASKEAEEGQEEHEDNQGEDRTMKRPAGRQKAAKQILKRPAANKVKKKKAEGQTATGKVDDEEDDEDEGDQKNGQEKGAVNDGELAGDVEFDDDAHASGKAGKTQPDEDGHGWTHINKTTKSGRSYPVYRSPDGRNYMSKKAAREAGWVG
jgi:hypothetical protein